MSREKMLMYHKGAIHMNEHFSGVQVKNKPLTIRMDRFPRTVLCCWTNFFFLKSHIYIPGSITMEEWVLFRGRKPTVGWIFYFSGHTVGSFDASIWNCDFKLDLWSFPKCGSGATKEGCILLPLAQIHDSLCVWKISSAGEEDVGMDQKEASFTECHDVMC